MFKFLNVNMLHFIYIYVYEMIMSGIHSNTDCITKTIFYDCIISTGVNHMVDTVQYFSHHFNKGIKLIHCTNVHRYCVCS